MPQHNREHRHLETDGASATAGREWPASRFVWAKLAALTVLSIYFFLFMEWLFFATKPSFLGSMTFVAQLGVLALPALLLSAAAGAALTGLFAAALLLRGAAFQRLLLWVGACLPAAFLASSSLLLLDNFTHTVLKFSIVHSEGMGRAVYALLLLAMFAAFARWAARSAAAAGRKKRLASETKAQMAAAAALLALSLPLGALLFRTGTVADPSMVSGALARTPNILLIGADGVNAANTSIYGQADTTPFLQSMAGESLLAANNFPNATITTGSLVSIFSGKLPTQTRMLYPPDILQGSDAFQHLPGILKKAGYYTATIGIDYYADPEILNLQDGFAMINGRSETMAGLYRAARRYLPENAAYFLSVVGKRLRERALHIFFIQEMPDPYGEVTQQLSTMSDEDRVGYVISLFRDVNQPLFIHTHLMGTHIPEMDGYLEGVRGYDAMMKGLLRELELMGELDNTLVVVYSDHGHRNVTSVRIPLMFRFPNQQYTGVIAGSTQNLDIAPTILDYLGMQPPAWMEGQSLLRGEPERARPIFSVAPSYRVDKNDRLQLDLSKIQPPFYQFGTVMVVVCQNWYALNTTDLTWQRGEIEGYQGPCAAEDLPDAQQARELILRLLEDDGFDLTQIQSALGR